jgi:hypothetical protein
MMELEVLLDPSQCFPPAYVQYCDLLSIKNHRTLALGERKDFVALEKKVYSKRTSF